MNAKKLKHIRAAMRQAGLDPKQRAYNSAPMRQGQFKDLDGTVKAYSITGTIALSPDCGRAKYQDVKAAA